MIRVLGRQTSGNVQKVLFLLEEIGVKYAREDYGRQFINTNTDAYRKLNPNMKVPTVVDGDLVIWESHTILRYLAALHQPALAGATPAERGADFGAQSADLVAQLKILDGHIGGKSWFALDRLTLADIALGPIVARCLDFPIERPPFADLTRWMTGIQSRPAFAVATGAKPSALNAA